ncbi:HAMP domain-containing histidine kinase [Domibacillus indicus]|uniref:sensor histidine kinase n=1 Tax=Domibacillus indicus TaxID=1437523 RepID=UPI00203E4FA4|nr:HAMP domain-containing sensor histidine kinase [Domibacillus indicus]MCM3789952.1 HAMP domain-containing histidine kinase [Domibacillus indicus]
MNTTFETFQVLLLHLLLILTFFFLFIYVSQSKWNRFMNGFFNIAISGSSIILCMTFPIITPSHTVDFRQVPFFIGSLYGGRKVAFVLFIILIAYRLYLGYPDFQGALLAYTAILILLWITIPFFHKATVLKRKLFVIFMISFIAILSIVSTFYLSFPELMNFSYLASASVFFLAQFVALSFFIIFIEKSRSEKHLTKEIRKLEKLKTISDIAASISHEVRNPLTVSKGFLQMLRDPLLKEEEKNRYIDIAVEELDRAESVISDYLTFAKPSIENVRTLNLKKELTSAIKVIKPFADMNNVYIELQQYPDVYIAGEDQKLHQSLINLIKNAIEAIPEGGKVAISLQKQNGKAVITIEDTGVGMTEEQIERLGTPYYTTKEKGTGLGTMVIFSIIKAMRGEIKVNSEVGKGTRFTILLPLVEH